MAWRLAAAATAATAAAALVGGAHAQNLPLPPLPYEYDALEPFIDEETMRVHHLRHHQGYTNKLNAALAELRQDSEHKYLAKMGVDKLLRHLDEVPSKLRGGIRNNGGGYVNHEVFWNSMHAPDGADAPKQGSRMEAALAEAFGSVDGWKQAFTQAALGVFGSGWAWLVVNESGALAIETTANQDLPAGGIVLGLDVWEHAYYIKYQNKRDEYVRQWMNLVDWSAAEARLDSLTPAAESAARDDEREL